MGQNVLRDVVTFGLVPEVSGDNCLTCRYRSKKLQGTVKNTPFLQVPVQKMDHYLQLMVQIMGHQPQNRLFLHLMVQKMGHQPHCMAETSND